MEVLAVLRGERDSYPADSDARRALQRAIDVIEGQREPLGPSCSAAADSFMRRMLKGG
jgi:hypothetical protein